MGISRLYTTSYVYTRTLRYILKQAKCMVIDTNVRVNKYYYWLKPTLYHVLSLYKNVKVIFKQAKCIVNETNIRVNKYKHGYKQTLYHVLSLYKNVKVIYKTSKMYS